MTAFQHDGIPARVLKELHSELAVPLFIIFNKSIEQANVPTDWKEALVTVIFKKGTRSDTGNYHLVWLASIVLKVLESLIRDTIVDNINIKKLYTECQHGFRKHRSYVTQLLVVMEDFTLMLNNRKAIDAVYLDYKRHLIVYYMKDC